MRRKIHSSIQWVASSLTRSIHSPFLSPFIPISFFAFFSHFSHSWIVIAISWLLLSVRKFPLSCFPGEELRTRPFFIRFFILPREQEGIVLFFLKNLTANRTRIKTEQCIQFLLRLLLLFILVLMMLLMLVMIQSPPLFAPYFFFHCTYIHSLSFERQSTKWTLSQESRHGTGFVIRRKGS